MKDKVTFLELLLILIQFNVFLTYTDFKTIFHYYVSIIYPYELPEYTKKWYYRIESSIYRNNPNRCLSCCLRSHALPDMLELSDNGTLNGITGRFYIERVSFNKYGLFFRYEHYSYDLNGIKLNAHIEHKKIIVNSVIPEINILKSLKLKNKVDSNLKKSFEEEYRDFLGHKAYDEKYGGNNAK